MKKILIILALLYGLTDVVSAQSPYSFLLHKTYAQRFMQLDSLFYANNQILKDSASFFSAVNELLSLSEKEEDQDLYLEAQFIKWRYYPYNTVRTDYSYLEARMAALLQQAEQRNMQTLQVRIRDNLGLYYNKNGNFSAGAEQYLNAYSLLKNISSREFPNKRDFVYQDLSSIYYKLYDYDNARNFLLEADSLPVFAMPRLQKIRAVININNTLGLVYRNTSRWDSAVYYFTRARNIAVTEKDTVWVGITGGNIGITYFLQKRYKEAVPLLEQDVRLSTQREEYHNAANSLLKLAAISLEQGDKTKAWQQMVQARSLTAITYEPYKLLDNLLPLMAKFYAGEGNIALAYRYADSARMIKDSLLNKKDEIALARALARALQKTEIEHRNTEMQQLENQKKVQAIVRNGLICILILLIAVTLLLVGRQRLLKKQKQYAEEREKLATEELNRARQQLQSFTYNIREKNELIERLTTEMNELQTTLTEEAIHYRRETLMQLQQSTILTENEWKSFKDNFERVYPGWIRALKVKLPGLSAADLRFLTLTKLNFSPREMAAMLGISPASIRMSRHRIRKKYNLNEEDSLELLADSI